MQIRKLLTGLATLTVVAALAATAHAAGTIVITGDTAAGESQPGWLFNRDVSTSTPFEFNKDAASIGEGSLYVEPITNSLNGNDDKFIAEYFALTPIANVTTFSYDFQIGPNGADTQEEQFYLNVYANFGVSDDTKFYDCRYNIVPTTGSTSGFTTVTFDPSQAYSVATRGGASASPYPCPASPADMDDLSPGSNVRAFAINVGDTSSSDTGLDGYIDNVVIDLVDDGVTIFDFESLTPSDKNECKKGGWTVFNTPVFMNQGDCVSFVASEGKSKGN